MTLLVPRQSGAVKVAAAARGILRAKSGTLLLPKPGYIFEDAKGTTPATQDGLVGLMLDAQHTLGPELAVNGGFDSETGWTLGTDITVVSGRLVGATATNNNARYDMGIVSGKLYKVTLDVIFYSSGTPYVTLGQGTVVYVPSPSSVGEKTLYVIASSIDAVFRFYFGGVGVGGTATIDNISVREVIGNYASQPTTNLKPFYRIGPVNRLTYSEDFSNAAWFKTGTCTVTGSNQINTPAANDGLFVSPIQAAVAVGSNYTARVKLSGTGTTVIALRHRLGSTTFIKQETITLTAQPTAYVVTGTVTDATNVGVEFYIRRLNGTTATVVTATEAMLVQGTYTAENFPAYVATTSAPKSNGIGPAWTEADLVDDKLAIAALGAGYASCTLIHANLLAVQTTQTAQDLSAGYDWARTNNCGLMICQNALEASELALLQRYANQLGGYSA